jgi:DnaK suppressor protein
MLEERARSTRAELEALSRRFHEEERPEVWDEGDRAAYAFGRELGSARANQLTRMLRQIEAALARHAEGRYGYCARCEGRIPVSRLQSLPFALYCRNCQEIRETEERRAGGGNVRVVA